MDRSIHLKLKQSNFISYGGGAMGKTEYELYTRVRLRDLSVATIVDRLGPDYIVDIGNNESDWDTVQISADEIVCKAVFEKEHIRKFVEVTSIDGDTVAGIVDDIWYEDEVEEGLLSLLLLNPNTDGIIEYKEFEVVKVVIKGE